MRNAIYLFYLLLAAPFVLAQEAGLIAEYDFENVTEILPEASDADLHGTVMGHPTPVADRFGNEASALHFSPGDYVVVPGGAQTNPLPFTVSVWYKPDLDHNYHTTVPLFKKYTPALWNGMMMYTRVIDGSNFLSGWYIRNSTNRIISEYGSPEFFYQDDEVSNDMWRHAVFTVDSTEGRLYFDGVLQDVQPWDGQPMAPTNNLAWQFAGTYQWNDTLGYQGALDDITIWGRALSEDEVADLYAAGGFDQQGCTDVEACNYDPDALVDNGECLYPIVGDDCFEGAEICADGTWWNPMLQQCFPNDCSDCPGDLNTDGIITISDMLELLANFGLECPSMGCTNPLACNYDSAALMDDGSCITVLPDACGCIYDCSGQIVNDTNNDGTCELPNSTACADTVPPVITAPAADLVLDFEWAGDPLLDVFNPPMMPDIAAWLEANGGASASDGCSSVTWTYAIGDSVWSVEPNPCWLVEPLQVTFYATDDCGNMSSTSALVVLYEFPLPVIVEEASNLTVECDGMGNATDLNAWLTNHGGAVVQGSDGSAVEGLVWTHDFATLSDDYCDAGTTVTFTATNACGSSVSTTATFTIEDTVAPMVEFTESVDFMDGSGDALEYATWLEYFDNLVSFTDNCSEVAIAWEEYPFGCMIYIVKRGTDACGNSTMFAGAFTFDDACDDPAACNYNPEAMCSAEGACTYPGVNDCGCPVDCDGNVINDPDNDYSCECFEVAGCTDPSACNYNPEATDEDGSCTFPTVDACGCQLDCSGNYVNDVDGDGVCDDGTFDGCNDPTACNYDPTIAECANVNEFCIYGTEEPGTPCDDGNANTFNDVWNETGCACVGTAFVAEDGSGPCAGESVLNYQDYTYQLVEIGTQCWFQENLRAILYSNGDSILTGLDEEEWSSTASGAVGVFGEAGVDCMAFAPDVNACGSAEAALAAYGLLYNFHAVADERNVCPAGWLVPSDADWQLLELNVGMSDDEIELIGWRGEGVGTALKKSNGWHDDGNGTNSTGFAALPGGYRDYYFGSYSGAGGSGQWWTSTQESTYTSWWRVMDFNQTGIMRSHHNMHNGYSIRCVKLGPDSCYDPDGDAICPEAEIGGCTDMSSCTYNESATFEDGSCVYPTVDACGCQLDCSGNYANDVDGDGVCDEGTFDGCNDPTACNYDPTITGCANVDEFCIYGTEEPGTPCDDGNANTFNDVWDETGCACAGTLAVNPAGSGPCAGEASLTFHGHSYDLVEIGDQCWFRDNLQALSYANGDSIPLHLPSPEWAATTTGAAAYFEESEDLLNEWGAFYNAYAVFDERGLCPTGWHVATDEDFQAMELFIGVPEAELATTGWRGNDQGYALDQNIDEFGFRGKRAGNRTVSGFYYSINLSAYLWSNPGSSTSASDPLFFRELNNTNPGVGRQLSEPNRGLTVRCIQ